MMNTASWSKLPKDLLVDEDIRWVENQLPRYLQFAPYMFYIAALRKADDDGMFDLEDGELFAQLMRIENPALVFFIANKFRKRGMIYRVGETSICGFCNWEYPQKEKPRTMEQRRQNVLQQIQEKNKVQSITVDFEVETIEAPKDGCIFKVEDVQKIDKRFEKGAVFFCPENDKNAENVVTDFYDDKIQKSVVKDENTERKKEILEKIEKETHTRKISQTESKSEKERAEPEESSGLLDGPSLSSGERSDANAQKDFKDLQEPDTQQDGSEKSVDAGTLAQQALNIASEGVVEKPTPPGVESYLNEFFAKNCYGYSQSKSISAIKSLSDAITELSDEKNPPEIVAAVLCGEFKRMHEGKCGAHWKDIPLFPNLMFQNDVWQHLLTYAGKILKPASENNSFLKAAEQAKLEAEADEEIVSVESEKELLKYGITADDPQRIPKLLAAKAAEQREKAEEQHALNTAPEPEYEEDEEAVYDIF